MVDHSTNSKLNRLEEKRANLLTLLKVVERNSIFTKEEVFSIEVDLKNLEENIEDTKFEMDARRENKASNDILFQREKILDEVFKRSEFSEDQNMMSYFVNYQEHLTKMIE